MKHFRKVWTSISTGKNISETIEQFILEEADNAKQTTIR